jgi:myo-inositol-1(or 4)-monophosphatase
MTEYRNELEFAKNIAFRAGEIMLKYLPSSTKTVKENNSPVTEADIEISQLVINEVNKSFPNHAVLDEEIRNSIPENEFVWVCDPVDGTIPFANGVPTSMFSLALCRNQKPVVAVCYDPVLKKLFYSLKDSNSYMNDQRIRVSEKNIAKGETVLTVPYTFNIYLEPKKLDLNTFFEEFRKREIVLTHIESCVYSAMLVASGKVLAAILPSAHPWDRAAAKLIVENAGGKNYDETGSELTVFGKHSLWVATNRIVSKEILEIINASIHTSS